MNAPDYIVIIGVNKAGTTSVFNYFASHPDVCPSIIKQTFYLLDEEMQSRMDLHSVHKYDGEHNYLKYFQHPEKVKLESSPEYFYSAETARRLKALAQTKNVKLVLLLRDPAERFKSLYRFGIQQGKVSKSMSFRQFYEKSVEYKEGRNASLMAYETGFYDKYWAVYKALFQEDLYTYRIEDFYKDNRAFMKSLATSVGLDPSFYEDYDFEMYNTSVKVKSSFLRSVYLGLRSLMIKILYKNKAINTLTRPLVRLISKSYHSINMEEGKLSYEYDEQTIRELKDAYQGVFDQIEIVKAHESN